MDTELKGNCISFFYLQYYNETHGPQSALVYDKSAAGNAIGNTLSPKEYHDVNARMQNRLEYLVHTCSNYGLDKPGNILSILPL